jgi:hypothetical protein
MTDQQKQVLMELATTLLVVALYWISFQPEWKLEMWLTEVRRRFGRKGREERGLSLEHRAILETFRRELSAWEHARKRDSGEQST